MPKKYFIPHTTKVEKNKDSFIATKKTYNIPPKSPGHRAEHKNLVSSFSFVPHAAQNPSWNGNTSAYIQHLDHAKKQSNIIDIPPINFDNLSYDSHCSSEIHSSQGGIDST